VEPKPVDDLVDGLALCAESDPDKIEVLARNGRDGGRFASS
jgi:hypothetical protein